jgi:hypothetical protein
MTFVSRSALKDNVKLFTVIHRFSMGRSSQVILTQGRTLTVRERLTAVRKRCIQDGFDSRKEIPTLRRHLSVVFAS